MQKWDYRNLGHVAVVYFQALSIITLDSHSNEAFV